MTKPNTFYLFTDGASRKNPGPGGWGYIIIDHEKNVIEFGESVEHATNNQMELTAVIKALDVVYKYEHPVLVYTDSQYLIDGITKWVHGWKKNDWKTASGSDVLNKELWERLDLLVDLINKKSKIKFFHVPSHVGLMLNERVDKIATSYSHEKKPLLYNGPLEDYDFKEGLNKLDEEILRLKNLKSQTKKKNKAPAYSYVSLIDGEIMTHNTWSECEARVRGVPYARFKKSLDKEDELLIIKKWLNKEGK